MAWIADYFLGLCLPVLVAALGRYDNRKCTSWPIVRQHGTASRLVAAGERGWVRIIETETSARLLSATVMVAPLLSETDLEFDLQWRGRVRVSFCIVRQIGFTLDTLSLVEEPIV
jgi:hypothetical protein